MYSEETDNVRHFRNNGEDVEGLAYDPRTGLLYYSTGVAVYRVGKDGSGNQAVLPLRGSCESGKLLTGSLYLSVWF